MKTDKEIGKRIYELRKAKNETREELAEIIGISYSLLVKYELGYRHIPDSKKEKLKEHFNLSIAEVFYEF